MIGCFFNNHDTNNRYLKTGFAALQLPTHCLARTTPQQQPCRFFFLGVEVRGDIHARSLLDSAQLPQAHGNIHRCGSPMDFFQCFPAPAVFRPLMSSILDPPHPSSPEKP